MQNFRGTALTNPRDKVVIFSPFYENYGADTILTGQSQFMCRCRKIWNRYTSTYTEREQVQYQGIFPAVAIAVFAIIAAAPISIASQA